MIYKAPASIKNQGAYAMYVMLPISSRIRNFCVLFQFDHFR